jgi:hypothetical protein
LSWDKSLRHNQTNFLQKNVATSTTYGRRRHNQLCTRFIGDNRNHKTNCMTNTAQVYM